MRTKHKRWLAKSLSWRIFGIVLLGYLTWISTGKIQQVAWITLLFHSIRFVAFIGHEWAWDKIPWWK